VTPDPLAGLPAVAPGSVPWLSVESMREVDRLMVDELGIVLMQMMENAGRNLAVAARAMLGGDVRGARVAVLCGPGGNGGGGLVAARHLAVAGAELDVHLATGLSGLAPVPRHQADALAAAGVPLGEGATRRLGGADLVVDALLGYSLRGAPRGPAAELIGAAQWLPTLALDVPSGLELATGTLHEPSVRADVTMTLALPKEGLRSSGGREAVGRLLLADISVPGAVYRRMGLDVDTPFGHGPLVRLEP